jgi:hypothetical protein
MALTIQINGPLVAAALEVAYNMYSDLHPASTNYVDPNAPEARQIMENRITGTTTMALAIIGKLYEGISEASGKSSGSSEGQTPLPPMT